MNNYLQWTNAVHSLRYGLAITNREGCIVDYNEFWTQIALQNNVPSDFNWHGVNLLQMDAFRSAYGDQLTRYCLSKLDDLLQGLDSFEPVQFNHHTSAGVQWLMLEIAPLADQTGYVQGLVISLHDISALHTETVSSDRAEEKPNFLMSRLLPMCAVCKRIRDSQDDWHSLESYLKNHLHIELTHDICTECMGHLYPQYAAILEKKQREQDI
ncbi:PAS domain-containing protein [Paenibacillus physcomitrellae]|uniref:PAC domain-containing protein n=1 Tax=Paenibacillus physcomitrellae TaxID=1619311 RepID=A0ABQ1G5C5_9BACL|nr:PAS domain-containing protein [Paenibacillus physcomitrellae]GGA37254.1 hypothetical protein GCM10010917_23030 [Paenibacillus physcomitrellae]